MMQRKQMTILSQKIAPAIVAANDLQRLPVRSRLLFPASVTSFQRPSFSLPFFFTSLARVWKKEEAGTTSIPIIDGRQQQGLMMPFRLLRFVCLVVLVAFLCLFFSSSPPLLFFSLLFALVASSVPFLLAVVGLPHVVQLLRQHHASTTASASASAALTTTSAATSSSLA